jgi:hypothetical protein
MYQLTPNANVQIDCVTLRYSSNLPHLSDISVFANTTAFTFLFRWARLGLEAIYKLELVNFIRTVACSIRAIVCSIKTIPCADQGHYLRWSRSPPAFPIILSTPSIIKSITNKLPLLLPLLRLFLIKIIIYWIVCSDHLANTADNLANAITCSGHLVDAASNIVHF